MCSPLVPLRLGVSSRRPLLGDNVSTVVVVLASHLHGENGRTLEKLAGERSTRPKGDVRTEGAPVRQVDEEANIVGQGITAPRLSSVLVQADSDRNDGVPMQTTRRRHKPQLAAHDLGLAVDAVEVLNGGFARACHIADLTIVLVSDLCVFHHK